MAVFNEKVMEPNSFIITARALDFTEAQFFENLVEKFPTEFSSFKVRTPSEYLETRQNLTIKFLQDADLDTLRKVAIALFTGKVTTEPIQESPIVEVQSTKPAKLSMSQRQRKNRRSRMNKSSKKKPEPELSFTSAGCSYRIREQDKIGWPRPIEPPLKKPRTSDVETYFDTPQRQWLPYMPVCNFGLLGTFKHELCDATRRHLTKQMISITRPPKYKAGKFASRPIDEASYRHRYGLHPRDADCDICDNAYRYNFFDDFAGKPTRIFAFIVLHHWILLGQSFDNFNWHPQTWQDRMYVDGKVIAMNEIEPMVRNYIECGGVKTHNQIRTYEDDTRHTWTFVLGKDPDPAFTFRLTV